MKKLVEELKLINKDVDVYSFLEEYFMRNNELISMKDFNEDFKHATPFEIAEIVQKSNNFDYNDDFYRLTIDCELESFLGYEIDEQMERFYSNMNETSLEKIRNRFKNLK